MTKHGYKHYSRPATDVYSRKHIDKQFDRLERLREHDKEKRKSLQERIERLEQRLSFTCPDYKAQTESD